MKTRVDYSPNRSDDSIPWGVKVKPHIFADWCGQGWYKTKDEAIEVARAIAENPVWLSGRDI